MKGTNRIDRIRTKLNKWLKVRLGCTHSIYPIYPISKQVRRLRPYPSRRRIV